MPAARKRGGGRRRCGSPLLGSWVLLGCAGALGCRPAEGAAASSDGSPPVLDASSTSGGTDAGEELSYGCTGATTSDGRPPICNVAHYAFRVGDLATAKAFYGDFLGLAEPFPAVTDDAGVSIAVYKINDSQFIELHEETAPPGDTNYQLKDIAFYTSDAEALRKYFGTRGITVPDSVSKNFLGNTSFTTLDPDGHPVEWVQYDTDSLTAATVGTAMPTTRIGASVHHLGVTIQNPAAATTFYGTLGFLPSRTGPSAPLPADKQAEEDPDSTVRLEYGVSPSGPPSGPFAVIRDHLCLRVADTLEAVATLNARNPAIYVEHHVLDGLTVRANTYDPNGSRIELADSILEFDGGEETSSAERDDLDSGANDDAAFTSTY